MASPKQYSFPLLKREEIFECLKELGITATKEELAKPTPEKMKYIYEQFVQSLMGITLQDLKQQHFSALKDDYELYENAHAKLLFYRHL